MDEWRAPKFRPVPCALSIVLLCESQARAVEPEVTHSTQAQFYEVASPSGQTVLMRKRLTSTLGVSAYDLLDRRLANPTDPTLTFRVRMRYDADFGADAAEATPQNLGRYVPGFERGPVDLMYAYVEGKRYLGGYIGFRVGRQYVMDPLGWWSFDGGSVRLSLPAHFAVEPLVGFEVRGGFPFSTSRFERDGIWRGARNDTDQGAWPSYTQSQIAPAYGASVETTDLPVLHARTSYRRVLSMGSVSTSAFGATNDTKLDQVRVSSERIGTSAEAVVDKIGALKTGISYDIGFGKVNGIFASVDGFASDRVTISADYDYVVPTFDGDSIWNYFRVEPQHQLSMRSNVDLSKAWSVGAGSKIRVFEQWTDAAKDTGYVPDTGGSYVAGGDASVRYAFGSGRVGARSDLSTGAQGHRYGGDIFIDKTIESRFMLSGRASAWDFHDTQRPTRGATSVGYVAGLGYQISESMRTMTEFEHNANRLVGNRYRVMLWLTIEVAK